MATKDFWSSPWTTATPGDMKNGGGLPTKFSKNPCGEIPLGKSAECVLGKPDGGWPAPAAPAPAEPVVNCDKPTTDIDAW
jgi:hypothetical protein